MSRMTDEAAKAIQQPEVQQAARTLAKYGLGVYMLHHHNDQSGNFEPMPRGLVQVERHLTVTFEPQTAELRETSTPVAWVWDEGLRTVAACSYCMDTQKGHSKFRDQ